MRPLGPGNHVFAAVLGDEDRLPGSDERRVPATLLVGEAFFDHGEVESVAQVSDLGGIVFWGYRQAVLVRLCREHTIVGDLVFVGEGEAALVGVAVDVGRLDGVEALPTAHVHPALHDRTQSSDLADVEPPLAGQPSRSRPLKMRGNRLHWGTTSPMTRR